MWLGRHHAPVTSERAGEAVTNYLCARLKKAACSRSLNLAVLVRFFERCGVCSRVGTIVAALNHTRPCEMSDHLGSGLSAYTDNGCGHVSIRVSRLRRRTLTWRGLARFPPIPCSVGVPSGWSPEVFSRTGCIFFLAFISLSLQLRARLRTSRPPCACLPAYYYSNLFFPVSNLRSQS